MLAMVFDNFWFTNFVADSHGVMEFQFDLAWRRDCRPPFARPMWLAPLAPTP